MRVAVYSGSFDPLHIGHQAIMEYLTRDASFDCVYLVISPQNPLKDSSKADNAPQRYAAAAQAVRRHPELNVRVDDIEMKMSAPHYTIKTLDALKQREPDNSFVLVIGADNLAIIKRWKDSDRILKEYGVVVFPREGYDLDVIAAQLLSESPDYKITIADAPLVNISSTQIRESGAGEMSEFLM